MGEARGSYGWFDRELYARPSVDSGSIHHPPPQSIGVNNQIFLSKKLQRTVAFHVDGVAKVAVNCREHGDDDAVLMVVGCFLDPLSDCKFRHGELLPELSGASISINWLTNFKQLALPGRRGVH